MAKPADCVPRIICYFRETGGMAARPSELPHAYLGEAYCVQVLVTRDVDNGVYQTKQNG